MDTDTAHVRLTRTLSADADVYGFDAAVTYALVRLQEQIDVLRAELAERS